MPDRDARPGRTPSPYSRTGLFPWGSTYDVPVRRDDQRLLSQTPCHLRPVVLPDTARSHGVRCPACGRAWSVSVDDASTQATWTA